MTRRKKRGHIQVVSEILDECIKPQKKTNIMSRLSLSYKMVVDYLLELQEAKLVETSGENEFVTTASPSIFSNPISFCYKLLDESYDLKVLMEGVT